jgi:DNA-binding XRE family transcriptional regulator
MEKVVTYYLDRKGRVFLLFTWNGKALDAFKSGFFPKDMPVEMIPKEENISGENLLMVEYLPGRKILLRVGDGILRSYEWKGVKKMNENELRIREIMLEKGISVNEMSEKLGITRQSFYSIVNGNPTMSTLTKIAEILGVTVKELFKDENISDNEKEENDERDEI